MRISYGLTLLPILAFIGIGSLTDIKNHNEEATGTIVARAQGEEEERFKAQTAGPSGVLKKPKGKTVYSNRLGNVGFVEVLYIGVSDGSNLFGARTCSIDLHLIPKDEKGVHQRAYNLTSPSTISLARGMRPHDSGSDQPIWATFVPPATACGDYHLLVLERQLFKDTVIQFLSAAPLITFKCATLGLPNIEEENSAS